MAVAVIANTADPVLEGVWQYSTDGTNWFDVGVVADGPAALVLSAGTRIRFLPVSIFHGVPAALTVRALDGNYAGGVTVGAGRATVDTSLNADPTVISSNLANLTTTVDAAIIPPVVPDPPAPDPDPDPPADDPPPIDPPAVNPPVAAPPSSSPTPRANPRGGPGIVSPLPELPLPVSVELVSSTTDPLSDRLELVKTVVRLVAPERIIQNIQQFVHAYSDHLLWQDLDDMKKDLRSNKGEFFTAGSAVTITSVFTAGYVLWTLRSGWLLTTLLAQMPAWRLIDPLVVLDYLNDDDDLEDDSLETMLDDAPSDDEQPTPPEQPETALV